MVDFSKLSEKGRARRKEVALRKKATDEENFRGDKLQEQEQLKREEEIIAEGKKALEDAEKEDAEEDTSLSKQVPKSATKAEEKKMSVIDFDSFDLDNIPDPITVPDGEYKLRIISVQVKKED